MPNVPQVLKRIQRLQHRYLEASQGRESLLQMIYESEVAEQVYNSNAIENSTLSLDETERILRQIDLDRFVTERELFETKNLARVVAYIARKAKTEALTMETILLLHKMLLGNIRDDIAGRLRKAGEWVRVGQHIAPDPAQLDRLLEDALLEFRGSGRENIITRVARFHLTFEHIHPFVDGNGRIGRVLNNYLLIREDHVPINIRFVERGHYYEALSAYDRAHAVRPMERIVGPALSNSYHKRLAYLEGLEIVTLADYAKRNQLSHPNLINKAKRQTIEAFLERGQWKIGIPGQ